MGDNFTIGSIENFNNGEIPLLDISDVSKIISKMIDIKRIKKPYTFKKASLSYSIYDKIKLNEISKNLGVKIVRYHNNEFDLIEDALESLESTDPIIRKDLFNYYEDVYIDILSELGIDYDNTSDIKLSSDRIYNSLISNIYENLFKDKKLDIELNKRMTYLESITAYVFYHCKFLIPLEK